MPRWRSWRAFVFVLASCLVVAPGVANAGAWTQDAGEGQAILSARISSSGKGFDENGRRRDIPDYDKTEIDLLLEYGLTDALTAVLRPQFRRVAIGEPTDAEASGLGHTELGARMRVWKSDRAVVSLQGLVRVPGSSDRDDPAQAGNTQTEYELRVLYGRSLEIAQMPVFFDAELAYRLREGVPDELHADVTLGVRPFEKIQILAQTFNTIAADHDQPLLAGGREHKAALSLVWDVADRWSVQLGGFATVAGSNALAERGVIAALWHRF